MVVIGGGFGGLQASLKLSRMPVEVTLIDRRNFHLFQPLVYQVATGALSPAEISYPLRRIFRRRRNVRVVLAEVTGFDLENRLVVLGPVAGQRVPEAIPYDTLIVSGGARYNYFGHEPWQRSATDLKTLEGALMIRRGVLEALEAAELEPDPARRAALLTFVLVGAGPTGVEMAGQIGEIAHDLNGDFRSLNLREARILLVEAGDRVLQEFPPSLSAKALRSLQSLGVTVRLSHTVTDLDDESVTLQAADGFQERIPTHTVVWAAGVIASELALLLSKEAGVDVDRSGRVEVSEDLSLPGHPEVLAIGDMVRIRQASGPPVALPGLAPVAMQEGRHAATVVGDRLQGRPGRRFRYFDKGNLATIGRARAVADIEGIHLSGFVAWVHVADRASVLPDRLREPAARADPLGVQLRHPRSRGAADRRGGEGAEASFDGRSSGRATERPVAQASRGSPSRGVDLSKLAARVPATERCHSGLEAVSDLSRVVVGGGEHWPAERDRDISALDQAASLRHDDCAPLHMDGDQRRRGGERQTSYAGAKTLDAPGRPCGLGIQEHVVARAQEHRRGCESAQVPTAVKRESAEPEGGHDGGRVISVKAVGRGSNNRSPPPGPRKRREDKRSVDVACVVGGE
ncbi:MAG: NAD(P)/FAD-dependent oxidoreductase [Solirubrobacterales bacterium]|nr:NAD(P)/FAD-dependent oxidoreductase [Solirubrobacterales bacterium]